MPKTALITGASSGIGMEFAGIFAREGYDLVLVARNTERLATIRQALVDVYDVAITYIPLDLATAGAPEALVQSLNEQGLAIDVLVNNAGIGMYGAFAEGETTRLRDMLRINVVVPTILMRLLLPGMLERNQGKILNVASISSFMPGPWMAGYYATKAHLLSLSEAVSEELKGTKVTITALCPGPTETPFFKDAHMETSKLVKGKKLPSAKEVAEYGYRAMQRNQRIAIPGLKYRMLVFLFRFMPRKAVAYFVGKNQERI